MKSGSALAAAVLTLAVGSASAAKPRYPKLPPVPPGPPATTVLLPPGVPLSGSATIAVPGVTAQTPQLTLAATRTAVWTSSGAYRIDPRPNSVAGPFGGGTWHDLALGAGSLWVSDFDADLVRRLDPISGRLRAVVRLPAGSAPAGVAFAAGAIWVAEEHGGRVVRIDPATNRVAAAIDLTPPGDGGPRSVGAGSGSLWVATPGSAALFRIDPVTRRIRAIVRFPAGMSPCGSIAVTARVVWVGGCFTDTRVGHIDPRTNRLVSVLEVAGATAQLRAWGDSVWFVASADADAAPISCLVRLRRDDKALARYVLPGEFVAGGLAIAFGSIWLADFSHPRVLRAPFPT